MAAKEKLFQLIEKDDLDGLNELLEDEFDFSIRNKDGKRALELSALLGRKNIIELLIQKEDNINVANSSGRNKRDLVLHIHNNNYYIYIYTVLTIGYTPVHLCCMWGHIDCLKVLIRAGADYNMKTRHEETVKQLSSRYGQTQCVSYLECTGMDEWTIECNINNDISDREKG